MPLKSSLDNISFKDINFGKKSNSLQITKDEALTYLFNSIKYNKNIDPNDITIDLNDDKNNDNDNDDKSIRVSELIDRNSKPSLRLSDLLAENVNICPTHEKMKNGGDIIQNYHHFPIDSELNFNSINKDFRNNYKKESEEINIGTKIRKKIYYNNNNEYNSIFNNHKKNKHIFFYNNNNNVHIDRNNERFLLNEKMSAENLNQNDKSDKLLNKRLFN